MANRPGTVVSDLVRAALDSLCPPGPLGIALSGGGDSTALMHLAHEWGRAPLCAATVDHGLRPESRAEAIAAGHAAASLGIGHDILCWKPEGDGNLMARARNARLRLLGQWAREKGLSAVLLGHTRDDQGETLLMRLGRGAGVDGLSAMAPSRQAEGVLWLRPLLQVTRLELRDVLTERGVTWAEDPSNQNTTFDRIRIRKALPALGLDHHALAQTAANMAIAAQALRHFAAAAAHGAVARASGLILPEQAFNNAPLEIRRRLIIAGLAFVMPADYPPRRETLLNAIGALGSGRRITLSGVIVQPSGGGLAFFREPAATRTLTAEDSAAVWDNRWQLTGLPASSTVRAVGHDALPGLKWRDSGLYRDEAAALPSVWVGGQMIAAPVLEPHPAIGARPLRALPQFTRLLQTH